MSITISAEMETAFMAQALAEAAGAGAADEVPAGAVLVDGSGRIIGRGRNRVIALSDPTAHAEILAIREAAAAVGNYRLTGCLLFSTLEPCPMCLTAALYARLSRVVYGAPEPRWGAAGSLLDLAGRPGLNHRLTISGGLLAAEAAELMTSFFRGKRKGSGLISAPENPGAAGHPE
ncbi:MAG: tRNA adenosine(34) deaminase TadA [Candidatus Adiutrix sp.]|jgi:tRNA(adenine34) deaminase|nr:tRNA adenosine(34) deaminase TadA [Candidatus Adiutrix sp.]